MAQIYAFRNPSSKSLSLFLKQFHQKKRGQLGADLAQDLLPNSPLENLCHQFIDTSSIALEQGNPFNPVLASAISKPNRASKNDCLTNILSGFHKKFGAKVTGKISYANDSRCKTRYCYQRMLYEYQLGV